MSDCKVEREMDWWICAVSAMLQTLYQTVEVQMELSREAKLLTYQ